MSDPEVSGKDRSIMHLSPGPGRRKASSGCKCLFRAGVVIGILLFAFIVYVVCRQFLQVVNEFRFPHKALYHNTTLAEAQRNAVVRPLIDESQSFDIAVSIWLRATQTEEEERRKNSVKEEDLELGDEEKEKGTGKEKVLLKPLSGFVKGSTVWIPMDAEDLQEDDPIETPLFSDVVFRGLRLSAKSKSTDIKFRLPTARFRDANLTSQDLRGSFVLIPSAPSLLDNLKNFSTWMPDSIFVPPYRAWPFPLGSPDRGDRTLVDQAVESFGISVPLIEFHEIQSRCPNVTEGEDREETSNFPDIAEPTAKVTPDDDIDDEDDKGEDEAKSQEGGIDSFQKQNRKLPAHRHYPHVVTRTHLRVVDETRLFDRKLYNKAHKELKANACGQGIKNVKASRHLCDRSYHRNGHWETRLQLEIMDENGNEPQIAWAYAPYLSVQQNAEGPKDLIPVPVSRENCSSGADSIGISEVSLLPNVTGEDEFMDVTWRISFSGTSPGTLAFADMLSPLYRVAHNESEYKKAMAHDSAELFNGFHGHKFHDDAHPRRRIVIGIVQHISSFVGAILSFHYWYTRTSTVSISIIGTALSALSILVTIVLGAVNDVRAGTLKLETWGQALFSVLLLVFIMLPVPLAMFKAIIRVEFGWRKDITWAPTMRIVNASHKERASQRLDAQTSWRTVLGLVLSLAAINYFLAPHDRVFVSSLAPEPSEHDLKNQSTLKKFGPIIVEPLQITGHVMQLLLNSRSRTFGGMYRIGLLASIISDIAIFSMFIPAIVGRFDARPGLSLGYIVHIVIWCAFGWQAITLGSVMQNAEDEDEE